MQDTILHFYCVSGEILFRKLIVPRFLESAIPWDFKIGIGIGILYWKKNHYWFDIYNKKIIGIGQVIN